MERSASFSNPNEMGVELNYNALIFVIISSVMFFVMFHQGIKHDSTVAVILLMIGVICLGGWAFGWVVQFGIENISK